MNKKIYNKHIRKLYQKPEIETIACIEGDESLLTGGIIGSGPDMPWGDDEPVSAKYNKMENEEYFYDEEDDVPETYYDWKKYFPGLR